MTTHHSFNRVFDRLKGCGDWNTILKMPLRRLRSIIKDAGLSGQKGPRIRAILRQTLVDFGEVTLNPLREMSDEEAFLYLTRLPGVGIKTAKCVLMYALKRKVLPVDTHGLRVARRLGLVPVETGLAGIHDLLEAVVGPKDRYSFHVNVIEHGRKVCLPRRPRCAGCVLRHLCDYGQTSRTGAARKPEVTHATTNPS